jgi:lipopolysaccharide transport system ATP-binding protein
MGAVAIRAEGLSKRYRIGQALRYKTLRDSLGGAVSAPFRRISAALRPHSSRSSESHIWALNDVSFEIRHGEVVGIIGRNGAGKSTLLKILSRITEPTEGYAEMHGRVGSLLEVGTGFHPELTGRENIYLNGAILGMKRREIDRKFDEIVAFAETERFLDTPVKFYSSGMYIRLAFAVAAHLEPEILIVDEVLAVGDIAFQKKCLGKMRGVAGQGRTVLLVSHNIAAIAGLCRSAYLLENGRLTMAGEAKNVIDAYMSLVAQSSRQPLSHRTDRDGDGRLRFTDISFHSAGKAIEAVQCGQDLEISIGYEGARKTLKHVSVTVGIFTLAGQCMLFLDDQMVGTEFESIPPSGRFACLVERFPLAPGQYSINLFCEVNGVLADWVQHAGDLTVEAGDFFGTGRLPLPTHGGVLVPHRWWLAQESPRVAEEQLV